METFSILRAILSNPLALVLAVLFFGASIFVHELGHFLAARWRGLKVERFSIGMGPRLFGWKDKQGVEWRVSLFPVGGYVLLPQLADMRGIEGESLYASEDLPELSYTDKIVVASAGAVFNVLFALAIATLLWITGVPTSAQNTSNQIGYVAESFENSAGETVAGPAYAADLQPGDRIVAVDGEPVNDFMDVRTEIVMGSGQTESGAPESTLTIERNGETFEVVLNPVIQGREAIRTIGIAPSSPLVVGEVFPDSPAERAGIQPGDRIIAANGEVLYRPMRLSEMVDAHPEAPLNLTILRDGTEHAVTLTPALATVTTDGETAMMIGVRWMAVFENRHINPFTQVGEVLELTVSTIAALLNPAADVGLRSMSGPIGILNVLRLTAEQGILILLWLVMLINVNLAVLNVLPLPVLDGGHMAFATWQKLTGKPLPPRVITSLQSAMMLALLGMVLYISFFDVVRIGQQERQSIRIEKARSQAIEPVFEAPEPAGDSQS